MITGRWLPAGVRPQEADAVWNEVFGKDGAPDSAPDSALDAVSRVALLKDNNDQCAAAGRMYYHDGAYWLDAIAVKASYRGQGYGDLLTRMMIDMAVTHGGQLIRLEAPIRCAAFFGRYGFSATEEARGTIRMEIRAEDVRLKCGR